MAYIIRVDNKINNDDKYIYCGLSPETGSLLPIYYSDKEMSKEELEQAFNAELGWRYGCLAETLGELKEVVALYEKHTPEIVQNQKYIEIDKAVD